MHSYGETNSFGGDTMRFAMIRAMLALTVLFMFGACDTASDTNTQQLLPTYPSPSSEQVDELPEVVATTDPAEMTTEPEITQEPELVSEPEIEPGREFTPESNPGRGESVRDPEPQIEPEPEPEVEPEPEPDPVIIEEDTSGYPLKIQPLAGIEGDGAPNVVYVNTDDHELSMDCSAGGCETLELVHAPEDLLERFVEFCDYSGQHCQDAIQLGCFDHDSAEQAVACLATNRFVRAFLSYEGQNGLNVLSIDEVIDAHWAAYEAADELLANSIFPDGREAMSETTIDIFHLTPSLTDWWTRPTTVSVGESTYDEYGVREEIYTISDTKDQIAGSIKMHVLHPPELPAGQMYPTQNAEGLFPAVQCIHGHPHSWDFLFPDGTFPAGVNPSDSLPVEMDPAWNACRMLAQHGYIVVMPRIDILENGDELGPLADFALMFGHTLKSTDIMQALLASKVMLTIVGIDKNRIGILGHSGGSVTAMALARLLGIYTFGLIDYKSNLFHMPTPEESEMTLQAIAESIGGNDEHIPYAAPYGIAFNNVDTVGFPVFRVGYDWSDIQGDDEFVSIFDTMLAGVEGGYGFWNTSMSNIKQDYLECWDTSYSVSLPEYSLGDVNYNDVMPMPDAEPGSMLLTGEQYDKQDQSVLFTEEGHVSFDMALVHIQGAFGPLVFDEHITIYCADICNGTVEGFIDAYSDMAASNAPIPKETIAAGITVDHFVPGILTPPLDDGDEYVFTDPGLDVLPVPGFTDAHLMRTKSDCKAL